MPALYPPYFFIYAKGCHCVHTNSPSGWPPLGDAGYSTENDSSSTGVLSSL